jgi:hypothetical protein
MREYSSVVCQQQGNKIARTIEGESANSRQLLVKQETMITNVIRNTPRNSPTFTKYPQTRLHLEKAAFADAAYICGLRR